MSRSVSLFPFPVAAASLALALFIPACSVAETDYGEVGMAVARALQNQHYSRHDFEDEYSKRTLEHYLNTLDYEHRFFLASDVDQFRKEYATQLDDLVLTGDISPAHKIYAVFMERARSRVAKIQKVLKEDNFNFERDEIVEMTRKKLPWPKDEAAADDLWRRMLKNDLLNERLNRKLKADREAERNARKEKEADKSKADEKDQPPKKDAHVKKEAAGDDNLAPEEKIAKRWSRYLKSLTENDDEEVVNFFLSALASAYDPHSEYMSPSETENFQVGMKNQLVGIGALLGKTDEGVEIQGIVLKGPADKSGLLHIKDKIVGVGQGNEGPMEDIGGYKLQKVVDKIRGEKGTIVRLQVVASEGTGMKEITLKRDTVNLKDKVASANLIESKSSPEAVPTRLGWINLSSFYADMENHESSCTKDVRSLLQRLVKEHISGLVLDLRGNGGGSLDEAISMTGLFIKRGPVVQAVDWRREQADFRKSQNSEPLWNGPMVVITDKTSASASEILAAALQDYQRAVVVGDDSTFGKGTVQTILDMKRVMPIFSDSSRAGSLKVTIQKFYRIAGGSTQLKGVRSDVVLPSRIDAYEIGEDQAENPLPYDTIKPLKYTAYERAPLPVDEVRARSKKRIEKEPEFQYLVDDIKRVKDQIEKNQLPLSEKARQAEIDNSKLRRKMRAEERKVRIASLGEANKERFKVYRFTLENVDKEELALDSEFTDEQTTGMRLARDEEDEIDDDKAKFPYDLEPVKRETLQILEDLAALMDANRTAQAGSRN
jgi:carboxyl-terminal processing protease